MLTGIFLFRRYSNLPRCTFSDLSVETATAYIRLLVYQALVAGLAFIGVVVEDLHQGAAVQKQIKFHICDLVRVDSIDCATRSLAF